MLILSKNSRKMERRVVTRSDLFKRIVFVVEQKRDWKGAQTGTITLKPYLAVTTEYEHMFCVWKEEWTKILVLGCFLLYVWNLIKQSWNGTRRERAAFSTSFLYLITL